MEKEVLELLKRISEAEPVEFGRRFAIYGDVGVAKKLVSKLGLSRVTHVVIAARPGWLYLQLMDALSNKSAALHVWKKGETWEYTSYAEEKIKGALPHEAEEVISAVLRRLSHS